ncbi:NAD(P)H-binding protein [Bosea sp. LjRoot90]|uniref:NAD(P)H-binding protein n=1 Tax=Bosea sp. LjRoot90 TaxID=3342342 RepID=UPI003F4F63A2
MILVTGATGHVGRAVVGRLASLGHDVVAMVRGRQIAAECLPSEIALRVADYEDASALKRAFAGIDEVVLISSDGDASAVMRHHANAIEAAAAAGARHIIFTSIVDVDGRSPFYFAPVYRDAERRLAACSVPSTILRCGLYCEFILEYWLFSSQTSGELALPAGDGRVAPISRDDVAAAIAMVAADSDKSPKIHTVTGDLALDFGEITASYGETVARQVGYRPCSIDEYQALASAQFDDPWPCAFSTLCASIAEGRYSRVSDDFAVLTGRGPESFQDFLRRATSATEA